MFSYHNLKLTIICNERYRKCVNIFIVDISKHDIERKKFVILYLTLITSLKEALDKSSQTKMLIRYHSNHQIEMQAIFWVQMFWKKMLHNARY